MESALYIAATGMVALSEGLNVTAHNIANVSTLGYKKQRAEYADLIYTAQGNIGEGLHSQQGSYVAIGQWGHGVRVENVATIYTQGSMESSNSVTDLAINGKGFFQVKDDQGRLFYTRSGDFYTYNDGVMRNPQGLALQGHQMVDGKQGGLGDVTITKDSTMLPKATTKVTMSQLNVNPSNDRCGSLENPYFGMLEAYDGTTSLGLQPSSYDFLLGMTMYDSAGTPHEVSVFFDGVAGQGKPGSMVEFLVADTTQNKGLINIEEVSKGTGALMSGVLQFDSAGRVIGMTAYTPSEAGNTDLATWQQAAISGDGKPQFNLNGSMVSADFGVSGKGYEGGGTAADVGTDIPPMMTDFTTSVGAVSGFTDNNSMGSYYQDGYGEGKLSRYDITQNGDVVCYYSNGQHMTTWQIPLARFTSEDGLRREGDNLYAHVPAAGEMQLGMPGTENWGTIQAYNIEQSNVDIASEMVDLIVTQRGFQSNSKVVTTQDEMLKRAMELKRS